jgi:hypothetical protein
MVCVVASLGSPWSISIPPAHLAETFGFATPACWLAIAALLATLVIRPRGAVIALGLAELALIGWFAWAMWVVTTPRFSTLGFPFVGTDLIGAGWYAAAVALLVAAAILVKELNDLQIPPGRDLPILSAVPGFGLARLGAWTPGIAWAVLVSGALYLGSTDSPDPAQFADFGASGNVPPPIPRGPEWALLGLTAVLWGLSLAATARRWRRGMGGTEA